VDVAVVAGEVVVRAEREVRRGEEAFAFLEDRALEAVAVDPFHEVHERRLLDADAGPGAVGQEVVEVHLAERVFEPEGEAAVEGAARARLARDVGRDAEGHEVRQVPRDVDVGPAHVERVGMDRVLVGRPGRWLVRVRVVGVDDDAELDGRRVVGRRMARGRRDLG
jgi:hypothetical protein